MRKAAQRVKLTKALVDRATVPPGAAEARLWDTDVRALVVRVYASGARSYWLHAGSGRRGRLLRVRIGEHGAPWVPETARAEALRLLALVAQGQDVQAQRALERRVPNVAEFAVAFVRDYCIPHKRLSSIAADLGNLSRLLFADAAEGTAWREALWREARDGRPDDPATLLPAVDLSVPALPELEAGAAYLRLGRGLSELGRTRIDRLDFAQVEALHGTMRATPTAANRVLALLSALCAHAERRGLRPGRSNPCAHVKRYREAKRERFLSPAELARLGEALADAGQAERLGPFPVAALRLLLLTGCRRSEILTARWEHVDLERGTLAVPAPKEGAPKVVRLSAPALRVLADLPRFEGNPYVIVGRRHGTHLQDIERPWRRVAEAAALADVRLHDLRHAWASVAASGGASLPIIGALLGHRQAATTMRYAHLSDDPLRETAEAVGAALDRALRPKARKRANVEPLRRRGVK